MGRFKLPDGSCIYSRLEAPKGQSFFVVPEADHIMRRLKPVVDDPVGMARLRTLLVDEHNLTQLEDGEVLTGINSAIQSGKLVWVGKGSVTPRSAGVGVAHKEAEPAAPPPAAKKKEEVLVTPHLKADFKVVLFDRGGLPPYAASVPKYSAEPTYVLCSLTQSPAMPIFEKGGTLKVEGAGAVEAYEDEKLTRKFDISKPIPNAKLVGADPLKLWLKGKTQGKFTLKLEVESPSGVFKADNPAEAKMGVVKIQMKLHEQNLDELKKLKVDPDTDKYLKELKDQKLPDQKELTDEAKVKTGRLLHVQKDGNHGRAKLVLKNLAASEWPDGTDGYEIVLTASESADAAKTGAGLEVFDKEFDGTSKDKVKVSALKAGDVTLWVQGKSASKKPLDFRLDAGVGAGKTPRRNGDWARFTVVQIKEVVLEIRKLGGKPALWNEPTKRYYINTENTPAGRELKDKSGTKPDTLKAVLTEKIQGVEIHFMLAGKKDNFVSANWTKGFKWHELNEALKPTDKTDRKGLIHLSAVTDAKGEAVMSKLVLSRLGGEKYQVGAYIAQDPHLAKFADGHPDLSKRKPVLGKEFTVFRKIWVQLSYPKTAAVVARSQVVEGFKGVSVEYEEIDEKKYEKKDIAGLVEYEEWQFNGGASTKKALCVGEHNQTQFEGLFVAATAEHKPKAHMILCEHQWDPQPSKEMSWEADAKTTRVNAQDDEDKYIGIFDPPLDGGPLVVSGTWEWEQVIKTVTKTGTKKVTKLTKTLHDGPILETMVSIEKSRGHPSEFKATLPPQCDASCGGCAGGTAIGVSGSAKARLTLTLNGASGPWEGSSGTPHCLIVISSDVANFNNTILHEIGHQFNQVRGAKGWLGVPNHPDHYVKRGGQGPHCRKGASVGTGKDEDGKKIYVGGTCVMFHGGTGTAFCDNCRTDLRVRNLSDFGKDD